MNFTPTILQHLINEVVDTIEQNSAEITLLDQTLGDGDHVINLQRGLKALKELEAEITALSWPAAFQKIGMTLLSTMGGASGSLFGTFFISLGKSAKSYDVLDRITFSTIYFESVEAVKKRGKSDAGEKTMLDVLIPVAIEMKKICQNDISAQDFLENISQTAISGMESTRDMKATKGRASYMQEKSLGHIDAGARTSQLIISTIIKVLKRESTSPI